MAKRAIVAIGDSISYSLGGGGLVANQFYPARLQAAFAALGITDVIARNFGVSGNTTAQMIARMACLNQYETPYIGVIEGGINDGANGSSVSGSGATTTSIPVQAGHGARFTVGGYVVINGQSRLVTAISTDTLTVSPALSAAPTDATAVAHDTAANIVVLGQYLLAAGCSRLIVLDCHYMNWSSGGDNGASQNATYAAIRTAQAAAAATLGATYVDAYNYMRALIADGTYTQGDYRWHIADSNVHLNAAGEQILSDAIIAAMPSAWKA